MKKILIVLTVAVLLTSCKHKHEEKDNYNEHNHAETSEKQEEHNENEVHLTKEQLQSIKMKIEAIAKREIRNRIEVTGSIEVPPQSRATVYAPMEAFVFKTNLLPGDKVQKGQTVAVLQHPRFAELQYGYLDAKNKRDLAKTEYERKKMLYKSDIASQKSYQIAESAYRSAQSLVASYASQLKMAGLLPKVITQNGVQQYVYIKSPISGYVVANNLSKGKYLSANSEMIEIIDNDHLHAELNVFGSEIAKLKKGDTFIFTPNGIDKEYNGYIQLISQKIDDKTKTVNVHGHFEDEEHLLRAGTFINAQILLKGSKVMAIPEEAVVEIEGENFVFKAESDVEFIPLEVTTGNSDNGFIGLKTIQGNNFDIKIVTEGAHLLKGEFLKKSGGMEGHVH